MKRGTICRTVRQYSSEPIAREDMARLKEIAEDYCRIKNFVYQRYGGINALSKLYPGYTVQNEMTESGLREKLHIPSVYFYLAIFDALGDIKAGWSVLKDKVLERIAANDGFTAKERHYLRYVMKISPCLEAVLTGREEQIPEDVREEYERLAEGLEVKRLNHYLRRQVRRHRKSLYTEKTDIFSVSERAYRYADGGIYLTVKEKRKRVFIPLTDKNSYQRQIQVRLFPEDGKAELLIPVDVAVKKHADYRKEIGLATGLYVMLTTQEGHRYGERLSEYVQAKADYERRHLESCHRNSNPGRKKYESNKRKLDARMNTYINQELNRLIHTEQPGIIYLPKLPRNVSAGPVRRWNHVLTMWPRGYIRRRLEQKCLENSITVSEVFGKGIGTECSVCGQTGEKNNGYFICPECGLRMEERSNAAANALKRGRTEKDTGNRRYMTEETVHESVCMDECGETRILSHREPCERS